MLTHSELEDIDQGAPLPPWFRAITAVGKPIVAWACAFGPIGRRVRSSMFGRLNEVFRLRGRGEWAPAFDVSLQVLAMLGRRPGLSPEFRDWCWWYVARMATEMAGDLDDDRKRSIDRLVRDPVALMRGFDAACCLVRIAGWSDKRGDASDAVALCRRACEADPTWPEGPSYVKYYLSRSGGG
jgi:hypothetical protein